MVKQMQIGIPQIKQEYQKEIKKIEMFDQMCDENDKRHIYHKIRLWNLRKHLSENDKVIRHLWDEQDEGLHELSI